MATGRHISSPKLFASGDINEWCQRFEICSVKCQLPTSTKYRHLLTENFMDKSTGIDHVITQLRPRRIRIFLD